MIEAIARQYITGSMWRSYEKGEREFCGITIPDGLQRDQKLPELLITPSSKGVLTGIPGVPAVDDVNVTRRDIEDNFPAFKFNNVSDIALYETLLREGFEVISAELSRLGQVFVDTKFEFGLDENGDSSVGNRRARHANRSRQRRDGRRYPAAVEWALESRVKEEA